MNEDLKLLIRNLQFLHDHWRVDEPDCKDVLRETIQKLADQDDALRIMVYQYCTVPSYDGERFDHKYMVAGEEAFEVLGIQQGTLVPEDFI